MKDWEDDETPAAPPAVGQLTREQQALVAEHTPWRKRTVARLASRFGKQVSEDRIDDITTDVLLGCAVRFDEKLGVPFGAYALKAMQYAVTAALRRDRRRAALAHRAAASSGELTMGNPRAILGTEEEREEELLGCAKRAAAAIALASSFSHAAAEGAEDTLIGVMDRERALARLEPRQREVLERRYGPDEESIVEIAEAMKVGTITAKRAHNAALNELYAMLG